MTNKARSLAELNSQASLVVPLALPRSLPSNLQLDASSPWNVAALLSAALESTTLYTRLKTTDRANSSSLGNIADLLNVFGKQAIANLEMSFVEPPKPAQNGTNGASHALNGRAELFSDVGHNAYAEASDNLSESGSQKGTVSLDIDLSSPEELDLNSGGRRRHRKRHVFSQFLTYRGPENPEITGEVEPDSRGQGGYIQRRPKVHK